LTKRRGGREGEVWLSDFSHASSNKARAIATISLASGQTVDFASSETWTTKSLFVFT